MGVDLQLKLSSMKPHMSLGQSKLCDYVIENFDRIPDYSGSQLALSAGVSISTLHRFVKLLEFENFTAFRFAMKSDIKQSDAIKHSTVAKPADRVFNKVIQSAKLAHQSINMTLLNEVAKYIFSSERVYLVQSDEENFIFNYIERKLRNLNKSVLVIPDICLDVTQLGHKDLIISIEQIDDEDTIVSLFKKSYSTDAMLVRLSNNVNAKIKKLSDIDVNVPVIGATNDKPRLERFIGLMMVIDLISDLVNGTQE